MSGFSRTVTVRLKADTTYDDEIAMFNVIWQSPSVLFALAAVAAPILIHILVQRRAERMPFPTLRFLRPARLAAIRRHVVDDWALLAVRAAILAAAVAALAGPLVITAARRQSWDRRIVRAVVVDLDVAPSFPASARVPDGRATARLADQPPPGLRRSAEASAKAEAPEARMRQDGDRGPERAALHLSREFIATSLSDGIRRAVAWLENAPPARRELVVVSRFAIGSLTAADVAAVPASIGIRFERTGTLPTTRTVPAGRVLAAGGVLAREATLDGVQTLVRDAASAEPSSWPIEVAHVPEAKQAIDAAIAAVLSQRVWAPAPDRRARLVIIDAEKGYDPLSAAGVSPIRTPWMAAAAAGLLRDADLQTAAARVATGFVDEKFFAAPWQAVAFSADGRPLAMAAAESPERFVVASAAAASSLVTPLLMRSLANGLGAAPDFQHGEVAPIADRWLREWTRPAASPSAPAGDAFRHDEGENDRRWLWLAALCLMGIEMWMRRPRSAATEAREEVVRVA